MASPQRSLTEVARSILQQAEIVESQLSAASLPQPSSSPDSPLIYPSSASDPDLFAARMSLIDLLNTMLPLVRGPAEHLRTLVGPTRFQLHILRIIIAFRIHELVPPTGTITLDELSSKASVSPTILIRFLRHTFTFDLFCQPRPNEVAHTALSKAVTMLEPWLNLAIDHPTWMAYDNIASSAANTYNTNSTIEPRIPFELAHSLPLFDYLNQHSLMPSFSAAMIAHSKMIDSTNNTAAVDLFPWTTVKSGTVIDLGGGSGHAAISTALAFPAMKIIVQDVPNNRAVCEAAIAKANLQDRVRFEEHDFFTPQPTELVESGDVKAVFLRAILHDWPDDECTKILGQLIPYLKQGAKVFVMDRVIPSVFAESEREEEGSGGVKLSRHEISHLTSIVSPTRSF